MGTTVICFIAAGFFTACDIAIILTFIKLTKAVFAECEAKERRHRLKEFEKKRMCNSYCKFKESAKTEEELEWKCANCPVANL